MWFFFVVAHPPLQNLHHHHSIGYCPVRLMCRYCCPDLVAGELFTLSHPTVVPFFLESRWPTNRNPTTEDGGQNPGYVYEFVWLVLQHVHDCYAIFHNVHEWKGGWGYYIVTSSSGFNIHLCPPDRELEGLKESRIAMKSRWRKSLIPRLLKSQS